jgi:argininosuccinate synthase
VKHEVIDVTDRFYRDCLRYLLFGNVLKNDTYPLSVSAERMFQSLAIAEYARANEAYIVHGSTGPATTRCASTWHSRSSHLKPKS